VKCEEINDPNNKRGRKGAVQIYKDCLYVYERMEEGDLEPQLWSFNLSKYFAEKSCLLNRKTRLEIRRNHW